MTENSTGRKECTRQLSAMLERHIDPRNDPRIYWAKEVTFDYSTNHKIRVDYMRFQPLNNTTSGIEKGGLLRLRGEVLRGGFQVS